MVFNYSTIIWERERTTNKYFAFTKDLPELFDQFGGNTWVDGKRKEKLDRINIQINWPS